MSFNGWFCVNRRQNRILQEFVPSNTQSQITENHQITLASMNLIPYLRSGTILTTDIRNHQVVVFVYINLATGLWIESKPNQTNYCILLQTLELWQNHISGSFNKNAVPQELIKPQEFEHICSRRSIQRAWVLDWAYNRYGGQMLYHKNQSIIFIDKGVRELNAFEKALNGLLSTPEFGHEAIYIKWFPEPPQKNHIEEFLDYVMTFGQNDPDFFPPLFFPKKAKIVATGYINPENFPKLRGLTRGSLYHEYYVVPKHAPVIIRKINLPPPIHHCSVSFYQIVKVQDNYEVKKITFEKK